MFISFRFLILMFKKCSCRILSYAFAFAFPFSFLMEQFEPYFSERRKKADAERWSKVVSEETNASLAKSQST